MSETLEVSVRGERKSLPALQVGGVTSSGTRPTREDRGGLRRVLARAGIAAQPSSGNRRASKKTGQAGSLHLRAGSSRREKFGSSAVLAAGQLADPVFRVA